MTFDQPPISKREPSSDDVEREDYDVAMKYRADLQRLVEASQSDYDKAVMALSGGALGVSFAYLKDVAGPPPHPHQWLVTTAWGSWTMSVTFCLFSLAIAGQALRQAIDELDARWKTPPVEPTTRKTRISFQAWDWLTGFLNWSGGILFAVGAGTMVLFVSINHDEQHADPTQTLTARAAGKEERTTGSSTAAKPAKSSASPQVKQTDVKSSSPSSAPPAANPSTAPIQPGP